MRRHHIFIPIAALLAILPLIVHGCSCGHDLDFHLQSWLDAAQQLRHGTLYPHWIFSAAWNAGEPRFIFYPPHSWLLGALLTLIFPINATPIIFSFLCLTAAGFAMHHLARHFTSPNAALLAAILYLANPYMLFNAFERTAYAELLAAAWIPLLFLAVLSRKPTIPGIAVPIALLWLTNAPAAVMGCYTFALLAIIRLASAIKLSSRPEQRALAMRSGETAVSPARMVTTFIAGTALGLTLPAFYLIPAAWERRFVQIAMAIIPNMRFQDNFLFTRTADEPHNLVLHTASLLAVTLLLLTFAATITLFIRQLKLSALSSQLSAVQDPPSSTPAMLLILTLLIAFLLIPASTPIWNHLPNLAFLQFPWRLLTILSAVLAFTLALLFNLKNPGGPFIARFGVPSGARFSRAMSGEPLKLTALLGPLLLSLLCIHLYRQPCDPSDLPTAVLQAFTTHRGVAPTDEYTPTNAHGDTLRTDSPGYWLSSDPTAFAPNTLPNPDSTNPDFDSDDIPYEDTVSAQAPLRLRLNISEPKILILNLRDYPNWQVTTGCPTCRFFRTFPHVHRDDGLLAIPVSAGLSTIDITWQRTADQKLGLAVSACALLLLGYTLDRSRKIV